MALVRQEVKGEIRIIFIDEVRLMDGTVIDQCYREILEMLEKNTETNVLLHFGRLTFMSSSALGMLIRLNKKCKEYKVVLKLSNIAPDIFEVFRLTGLNKIFDIHDEAAQAMAAFKQSGNMFFRKAKPSSYDVT